MPGWVPDGDVACLVSSPGGRVRGRSPEGTLLSAVTAARPMAGLLKGPWGVFRASSSVKGGWLCARV